MANDKMFWETLYTEWSLIQKGLNHSGFIKFLYVIPEGKNIVLNILCFLTLCRVNAILNLYGYSYKLSYYYW